MNNADMPIDTLVATDALARTMRYEGIEDTIKSLGGLTKREYFAAMAMQGWLARCSTVPHTYKLEPSDIAEVAVSMADALLKELNK